MSRPRQHHAPEMHAAIENLNEKELRVWTRCADHGEQTIIFPAAHLLVLARTLLVKMLEDEGVEVFISTFLTTPGLQKALYEHHQAQKAMGLAHRELTEQEAEEILMHLKGAPATTH